MLWKRKKSIAPLTMSKLTKYTLNNYAKAIEFFADRKFGKFEWFPNKGSMYTFRLYEKEKDQIPCQIWSIHVEHSKKKKVWSRDLEKAWVKLAINKEEFMSLIDK